MGKCIFLGTGASAGVPIIGCHCDVCSSPSPFNKRLRPSALLQVGNKQILVDAGPDLREQALKFRIDRLDGVILTHAHFDHIGGVDELRAYFFGKNQPLPCLVSKETHEEIVQRYPYLFHPRKEGKSLPAQIDFHVLTHDFEDVIFCGVKFHIVSYFQGGVKVTGFHTGDLAFISDIREYSPRVVDEIKGVKKLIVSALREKPSVVHFSFEEGVEFSKKVAAEKTWFTHIAHESDHEKIQRTLPSNVSLAYDGLAIDFSEEG